ncbi:2796_t:CDS:2, partial [Entrophospora sp. SA101]
KEFVKSKLSINEISDKDKSDNPKDKPKVYINEISNNQCVVIQILFNLEKGKIIEYPKKIGNKIKKDNEGKGSQTPKLMMLRRSNKDEKKYKIYSMEYNSNADDHLELLDTHNIYSDETPKIYYDDNHFLAAASHSLISEWNYCYKGYNYKQNYYLKYNDYIVLNKQNKAEEALMVADYRRNSKLVVYSLERNITVSSFEFKEEVHIKKVDFVYVDNGTFGYKSDILKDKPKVYIDEISNNQCVVIQSEHCILFNLEKGKIIEYPKKIRNKIKHDKREKDKEKDDENDNENEGKGPPFEKEKGNKKDNNKDKGKIEKYTKVIFQNNDKSNSKLVKLMMLRRSHKDEKKYKIYSMEYNSNSGDLKLLHTHNIYSDETPRIYYDVNHFLVASSHSLISEWSHNHRFYEKSYNYEKNYYLKSNDYMVLNKKNKAEEALMGAADLRT